MYAVIRKSTRTGRAAKVSQILARSVLKFYPKKVKERGGGRDKDNKTMSTTARTARASGKRLVDEKWSGLLYPPIILHYILS